MSDMHLGVCYYPEHWPESLWADDAQRMVAAGLTRVRIGEFAWSRIEPEDAQFDWGWLDRAIAVLHSAGLRIILGTPTATPPKWLVDQMPDMLAVGQDGRVRGYGSRRHYCFSHAGYHAQAVRITRALAERYGHHLGVVAWQTDNEYGCHDTVESYSPAARSAFQRWCSQRYASIAALNSAWGNVFWSMEYRSFAEIELPNLTVTEANPAHWLAFRRFSSDQVIAFNRAQVDVLRAHSPGRDITHNAMGFFTAYDHHALGADLDVLGWDSYPLGFLETFRFSEADKQRFAHQGHPDIAAFHHDLYRGCTRGGRWSVLEQQPGPVNWARHNPAPLPGMVRLWTLEAFAHGAEMVSYFRWRQFPKAQEQMHAGLLRPDNQPAPALAEVTAVALELAALASSGDTPKQAAIIFAYEADWMTDIQPHGPGSGASRSALWAAFACYSALRRLGLNVDIVPPGHDLAGYALVVVPCLPIVSDALAAELAACPGQIVIGPRTGSRDTDFGIPTGLPPGPLRDLLGLTVILSESWPDRLSIEGVAEGMPWQAGGWYDHVEGVAVPDLVATDGRVASWQHGRVTYCAAWPAGSYIETIIARAASAAGLPSQPLPYSVRQRRLGNLLLHFDYDTASVTISPQ
ncbi:beta-galactosidase [Sandarakinorhabdus sp.]|uniref:beta-galactosidase n=1 Tax=Sandarakinorhabdus sp. TaxID=1916663 RepID=UPI0033401BC6